MHSLCLDRFLTKLALRGLGIPTPPFFLWFPGEPWPENLEFPLLVKPRFREHRGKKLGGFLVQDDVSLRDIAWQVAETTREKVLVEKYITGREFVVELWGNDGDVEYLPVVEVAPLPQEVTFEGGTPATA